MSEEKMIPNAAVGSSAGSVAGEQAAAKLRMAGIMRARKCIKSRLIAESDISVAR